MVLKIGFEEFKNEILSLTEKGEALIQAYKGKREETDLISLKEDKSTWKKQVITYVSNCFNPVNDRFQYELNSSGHTFNTGFKIETSKQIEMQLQLIKGLCRGLIYYSELLAVYDAYTQPEDYDAEAIKNLDTAGILELILSKLYDLKKVNSYHSIKDILEGNGIELEHGEDWEYGKQLESLGFIDSMNARTFNAKLSLNGKLHVENSRKTSETDYSQISDSDKDLHTKIDFIIEELKKRGYADQIIFEEIEELREEIPVKNKKKFGQLVKGKIVDLVMSKAIDAAAGSEIFKELTNQAFNLLGS